MSHPCILHNKPGALTMEKSVQCDSMENAITFSETEKDNSENQENVIIDAATKSHTPFSAMSQDASISTKEPQPLVKALTEEKHAFLRNFLGKSLKDEMNSEILDFHKDNRPKFCLNPGLPKPASLVTVVRFQKGEFVEVNNLSSYNSSMCLRDMKNAISAALDSCITQANPEIAPRPAQTNPLNDVTAKNANENSSQEKSITTKQTQPKTLGVDEGDIGTAGNTTGTSEGSKPDSPKGNSGGKGATVGYKGTQSRPKSTSEAPPAEKLKKTPEKVKTDEVPKGKLQTNKGKVEAPPKPKASKPAQVRVKKPKIPDEESIKFANRQREIQRMKKELKERLKKEGKEGVDPAARINAWGRTVGVTCTMCGNHVQKSYGCFRRDTAPEKLVHLFTPGMNRIKICRRCLPYKKQVGKTEQILKPGLLSLPKDLQGGLNPGNKTPVTIAPITDKAVSAATLNAIHRKVTGQENTGRENNARANVNLGHANVGPGHVNVGAVHVNNPNLKSIPGIVSNVPGNVNTIPGIVNNVPGIVINSTDHMNTVPGIVINSTDHVNNVPGLVINSSAHVNPGSFPAGAGHVIDSSGLPSEIDLSGDSSQGSAIEYIKKLALNLRTNYNEPDAASTNKNELVTPEEQIIKTPILEHLSNFTPVTPSMNLTNQATSNPATVVATAVSLPPSQWKPVVNQVAPVNKPVTPETTASFVQTSDGNLLQAPPWTALPIVLNAQPNMVLTSSNQAPRDPKSTSLQTFVTAANQKDLKLVPTIMVPSQNTLPRGQGPVLLQIQRVKLVREKTGEKVEIKDNISEEQGKRSEMVEQSPADLPVTDFAGYAGNIHNLTGNHQQLPGEISSTEVENSMGDFLTHGKDVFPAQVDPLNANFQTLTDEISSTQLETSTGNIKKITEELASLIGGGSVYTQDNNEKMMDAMGHLSQASERDNIKVTELAEGSDKHENLNVVDTEILRSEFLHPNEAIGEKTLSSEGLGMSYSQNEPVDLLCASANVSSQDTASYAMSGPQVVGRKDGGQEGLIGASDLSQSGEASVFQSQISEEFPPQTNVGKLSEINQLENIQMMNEDLLNEVDHLQDEKLPDVMNVKDDASKDPLSEKHVKNIPDEANDEDTSLGMTEDAKVKEKEDCENVKESSPEENQRGVNEKDDLHVSTKSEKQEKMKDTRNKDPQDMKSATDESISLDLRRSQRRTASPRKLSPSKSPAKKFEPRVHGTRQSTLRQKEVGSQGSQTGKAVQQGTTGHQGSLKGKTGQQGLQKEKTGQLVTQRSKTERQGSQKDEKEQETTQGVKRKRQGRGAKTVKAMKT
ncbi:uncharacterized protein LOC114528751 [Dendronephthya gigantea]|uniref:uncharacterized protein LOC114528751 n=1 Tax=Dendronephthya gigantea TaxID=151771 RepID=UPI00106B66F6|nr:uncharacterized protein LOC114528751 [Dendronephthya gigantea]